MYDISTILRPDGPALGEAVQSSQHSDFSQDGLGGEEMHARMLFGLLFVGAALVTGCAKAPKETLFMTDANHSAVISVVAATSIIAPELIVPIAVGTAQAMPPEMVGVIAKVAAATAPDQALKIQAALVAVRPHHAEEIVAATKVPRIKVVARVAIPKHEDHVALVNRMAPQ